MSEHGRSKFEVAAAERRSASLVAEFWQFLRHNKKWWLLPLLIILLPFGLFLVLAGTGVAPLLYTLF